VEALSKIADFTKQASAVAFVVKNLATLLTATSNKEKIVAAAACTAVEGVIANLSKYAVALVVPVLIESLGTKKKTGGENLRTQYPCFFSSLLSTRDVLVFGRSSAPCSRLADGHQKKMFRLPLWMHARNLPALPATKMSIHSCLQ
jgi:hypothetical protein